MADSVKYGVLSGKILSLDNRIPKLICKPCKLQ